MKLESLYPRLPALLQHAACSWEGLRVRRERYGRGWKELADAVAARGNWDVERLAAFRDERLARFIVHAARTTPYYRELFSRLTIDPSDLRIPDDLDRIPVITRDEVKREPSRFRSETVTNSPRMTAHTSGTTGGGLRFDTTREAVREQWAVWWRFRGWHGLAPDVWQATFGGRLVVPVACQHPPFWRLNLPGRQELFSGFHLSPANLPHYVRALRRLRLPWLHGYPSLLALLAGHLLETDSDLGYQVRWVTTGAENLLPWQVELMRRAFGVSPRQHYGQAEAVANLSECESGLLHVDEDFSWVEFLPAPGGTHRIVGTNLSNPATPLLRYDTGDTVTVDDRTCPCGRAGRTVSRIDGRLEDYVLLPSGARVGRLDHAFKDLTNAREAQIRQRSREHVVVHVVPGPDWSSQDEERLIREMRLRLGDELRLEVAYVERIERTASGKLRFVVSEEDRQS
jgi:phenylacetate-CoA ligase